MGLYFEEMKRAMTLLGADPRTIFLGQWYSRFPATMADVPESKKIELPVIEEAQLGMSIGLSLAGFVPISCYVRWNFLLLATSQIVNHLDKLEVMSNSGYRPKVIIRTAVGSKRPLLPGCQSEGDFTTAFRFMLERFDIVTLKEPEDIVPAYTRALRSENSTILVEYGDNYLDK